MCGITALVRLTASNISRETVRKVTDEVRHRGPDGSGITLFTLASGGLREIAGDCDPDDWSVALGHRRLSILDLSDAGKQPMAYRGRVWITYNGEIYNFVELRDELATLGHSFASGSDTEVLLAAYDEWGTDCFQRFRGMWGLALLDARRQVLIVSRDRLGIKPVYVARIGGTLAVVSEIKQLRHLPGYRFVPRAESVARYLLTGFEGREHSFFAGVEPVPPGEVVEFDLSTGEEKRTIPYWWPERVTPSVHSLHDATERLEAVLSESVRIHLRSDVPVGCALSGGLDSSAITALIPGYTGSAPHTFSAIFPGQSIDESRYVDDVVRSVGTIPHAIEPTAEAVVRDFDSFLWHHDEPVGSLSQYAGFAVARLTREAGVPVTLNGQGGDEVLSGYLQCYFVHLSSLLRERNVTGLARELFGALLPGGNREVWRRAPEMLRRYRSRRAPESCITLRNTSLRDSINDQPARRFGKMSREAWRLYELRDLTLPRLLKWDDRNFMAFAVEGRYPFLDHRVIETCLSFDQNTLYECGWIKAPLRHMLDGRLPESVTWRKTKIGFVTPQERRLSRELRAWIDRVVVSQDSPLWEYVEPASARRLADQARALSAYRGETGEVLFRLLMADRWLRASA